MFHLIGRHRDGYDEGLVLTRYLFQDDNGSMTVFLHDGTKRVIILKNWVRQSIYAPDGNLVWCKEWAETRNTADRGLR